MAMSSFFRGEDDSDESNSSPHACTASVFTHLVISPAGGMVFLSGKLLWKILKQLSGHSSPKKHYIILGMRKLPWRLIVQTGES